MGLYAQKRKINFFVFVASPANNFPHLAALRVPWAYRNFHYAYAPNLPAQYGSNLKNQDTLTQYRCFFRTALVTQPLFYRLFNDKARCSLSPQRPPLYPAQRHCGMTSGGRKTLRLIPQPQAYVTPHAPTCHPGRSLSGICCLSL